jgi:hypothetical protein
MKRRQTTISLFVLLVASFILLAEYPRFKRIEKRGPVPETVSAILPGDIDTAVTAVNAVFNKWVDLNAPSRTGGSSNKFPYGSKWSRFYLFNKNDPQHPLFPPDEEILRNRGVDTFVESYVRIPAELRTRDLYLYEATGDYFWESEYFYHGNPAKFRCSFLIHFEPAGGSGTNVEIFEYQPMIWAGEYLGMSAHAVLPTMLHDIRPAQPTTKDRKVVLLMIEDAASSPAGISRPQTP